MRRSIVIHLFVLMCLLATAPGVSRAGIIYSALPNQSGGSEANAFLEADDITLATNTDLTAVKIWTFQSSASDYTGSIAWSYRRDSAGVPGTIVASGTATPSGTATGISAFGLNEFSYSFPTVVTLAPGTYWLVLHNGPNNAIPPTDFFWEWSNGNSGNSVSQDLSLPGQPWIGNFAEFALQVQNTPEPGGLLLSGAGLLAVWAARRPKRN